MGTTPLITIEIDPRAVPIGGWLQAGSGSRLEFQGMLELISLLDAARRELAGREVVGAPRRASGRDSSRAVGDTRSP